MPVVLRATSVLAVALDAGGCLLVAGVRELADEAVRRRLEAPLTQLAGSAAWWPRWEGEELVDVALDCSLVHGAAGLGRLRVLFGYEANLGPLGRRPGRVLLCTERGLAEAGRAGRFGRGLVLPTAPVASLAELVV